MQLKEPKGIYRLKIKHFWSINLSKAIISAVSECGRWSGATHRKHQQRKGQWKWGRMMRRNSSLGQAPLNSSIRHRARHSQWVRFSSAGYVMENISIGCSCPVCSVLVSLPLLSVRGNMAQPQSCIVCVSSEVSFRFLYFLLFESSLAAGRGTSSFPAPPWSLPAISGM